MGYSRTPAPVLGGVEVISPTNCIKEIFDVVNISQVYQNCDDKIMMTTPQSSTPRDTSTKPLTGGTKTVFSS